MKSIDLQKLVFSKYQKGEDAPKIFQDLNGAVSYGTIRRWCKTIAETGALKLSTSPGRSRAIRTEGTIQKVKSCLKNKKQLSARKLGIKLGISGTTTRRILKDDLNLRPCKKRIEPALTEAHKGKRVQFANWIRNNFSKADTMRILFSDEKMFDIDGVYNVQNERIWAVDRATADDMGGKVQKRKFPQKVMVWHEACSEGVTPLVIFDKGTVDRARYINEVLPVALKYGNSVFGTNWTFQQDGAKPHTHALTQQWCRGNFPSFIDKERWPANSPDLNPLDYSLWNELTHMMRWNNVSSKPTLINELKRAVKRIRNEVVLESCSFDFSFTECF